MKKRVKFLQQITKLEQKILDKKLLTTLNKTMLTTLNETMLLEVLLYL